MSNAPRTYFQDGICVVPPEYRFFFKLLKGWIIIKRFLGRLITYFNEAASWFGPNSEELLGYLRARVRLEFPQEGLHEVNVCLLVQREEFHHFRVALAETGKWHEKWRLLTDKLLPTYLLKDPSTSKT